LPAEPFQRLFFALWPDDPVRAALGELASSLGIGAGRRVKPENLHVTLVFLGTTSRDQRACVERCADAVRAPPFSLTLDRTEWWRRPQVVWAGSSEAPTPLVQVVSDLRAGCSTCGFPPEERPFQVHATLARQVSAEPRARPFDPIPWRVRSFSLVESTLSQAGSSYQVVREWPLEGTGSR
jgi:2'-5' RNA ligase